MSKAPGFWFFTGDWLKDPELRFCSIFARGLLVDLLCYMFEANEQGYLSKSDGTPRSDESIVNAISGGTLEEKLSALKELEASGVLSRDNRGVLYSRRISKLKELSELRSKSGSKGGSKTQAKSKQTPEQKYKQNTGVSDSDSDSDSSNTHTNTAASSKLLDNPNFHDIWSQYKRVREQKFNEKLDVIQEQLALDELSRLSVVDATEAVRVCAMHGWKSVQAGMERVRGTRAGSQPQPVAPAAKPKKDFTGAGSRK